MELTEELGAYSIAVTIAGFYCYHYLVEYKVISGFFNRNITDPISRNITDFLSSKLTGVAFLGLLPLVFFMVFFPVSIADLGLTTGRTGEYWYLLIGIPVLTVFISSQVSRNSKNQEVYPQMRIENWKTRHLVISFGGWTLYLFAYEFLFRGILWFLCYDAFGFFPALLINLSLYSSLHMIKGIRETIGAIPIGFLLCIFTWLTGSILLAFITHVTIAISTEWFTIYYNPEMQYIPGGK